MLVLLGKLDRFCRCRYRVVPVAVMFTTGRTFDVFDVDSEWFDFESSSRMSNELSAVF